MASSVLGLQIIASNINYLPVARNQHTKAVKLHTLATLLDVQGADLFCDRGIRQSLLPIALLHPITMEVLILFFCIGVQGTHFNIRK
jgi:hypothetical protein